MTRYEKFRALLYIAISRSALTPYKAVTAVAGIFDPNVETNINLGDLDQPIEEKVMEYVRFVTVKGAPKPAWFDKGDGK